ncbi:MAG: hypothetical protein ACFBZ8_06150 [Opitutales bacterium]
MLGRILLLLFILRILPYSLGADTSPVSETSDASSDVAAESYEDAQENRFITAAKKAALNRVQLAMPLLDISEEDKAKKPEKPKKVSPISSWEKLKKKRYKLMLQGVETVYAPQTSATSCWAACVSSILRHELGMRVNEGDLVREAGLEWPENPKGMSGFELDQVSIIHALAQKPKDINYAFLLTRRAVLAKTASDNLDAQKAIALAEEFLDTFPTTSEVISTLALGEAFIAGIGPALENPRNFGTTTKQPDTASEANSIDSDEAVAKFLEDSQPSKDRGQTSEKQAQDGMVTEATVTQVEIDSELARQPAAQLPSGHIIIVYGVVLTGKPVEKKGFLKKMRDSGTSIVVNVGKAITNKDKESMIKIVDDLDHPYRIQELLVYDPAPSGKGTFKSMSPKEFSMRVAFMVSRTSALEIIEDIRRRQSDPKFEELLTIH